MKKWGIVMTILMAVAIGGATFKKFILNTVDTKVRAADASAQGASGGTADPCGEYGNLTPQCLHFKGIQCVAGEVERNKVVEGTWDRDQQMEQWSKMTEEERKGKVNPLDKQTPCSLSGPVCRSKTSFLGIKQDDCLMESYRYGIFNDYLPLARQARQEPTQEARSVALDKAIRVLEQLYGQCEIMAPWSQPEKEAQGSISHVPGGMAEMLAASTVTRGGGASQVSNISEEAIIERNFVHERRKSSFRPCLSLGEMKARARQDKM